MRTSAELLGVNSLGSNHTEYANCYDRALLEKFVNKYPGSDYLVQIDCPEFTSLCPKTGQPDFAKFTINYIPNKYLVESKSLKLYLFSFRNNGDFNEDIVNIIISDLNELLNPKYIEVIGNFYPRGGISIKPFASIASTEYLNFATQRRLEYCGGG